MPEPPPDDLVPEQEAAQFTEGQTGSSPPPPEPVSADTDVEPVNAGENEKQTSPEEREKALGSITLEDDATYLVTVIIKNRGDTMRDKLRLRQVYGTLISFPGRDRFVFQIIENDVSHLLDFPNASTKVNKGLINQLRDMVGRENVQVEKYLF
jgi:hypothetical protein